MAGNANRHAGVSWALMLVVMCCALEIASVVPVALAFSPAMPLRQTGVTLARRQAAPTNVGGLCMQKDPNESEEDKR